MTRLWIVCVIAAFLAALGAPNSAAAQQPIPGMCIPLKTFVPMLAQMTKYTNLRPVTAERVAEAIEIFNSMPPPGPAENWSFAMLLDGPDDTGFLLVGKGASVCEFASFNAEQFGKLVRQLEGQRT